MQGGVLDSAHSLKKYRMEQAVVSLTHLGCAELAGRFGDEVMPPSRSWVNDFCTRHGFVLSSVTDIQKVRHQSAHIENLLDFLRKIYPRIVNTPTELLFNCDETMLSAKRHYKGVTLEGVQAVAPIEEPTQHMSSLVTICASGAQVPQMIVLSGLKCLPPSLRQFESRCWFASSSNGWVTRNLFSIWAMNFCHWLSHYRLGLPEAMQDMPAVLLLDGHSSRQNYAAMSYLAKYNVIVIVLPSHTTHIIQPFDVAIASSYKAEFKKSMLRNLQKATLTQLSRADALRTASVGAAVEAYHKSATWSNCQSTFRRTGFRPASADEIRRSPFVLEGRRDEAAVTTYQLSGRVLTDSDELAQLLSVQIERGADPMFLLALDRGPFRFTIKTAPLVSGRLLSAIHPCMIRNRDGSFRRIAFD